jgi:glycerol dehydrogenase
MRGGKPYLGTGRYIQQEGAAETLGAEIRRCGSRKAFILGGRTALSVALPRIEPGLKDEGIEYSVREFAGHCTSERCALHRGQAETAGAGIIVGVGGGKVLDTAKCVAEEMNLRAITVPTSAATCSACACMSVMYAEDGDILANSFQYREPQTVLVDMDIIARRCPPRMLASGIADAAAKYPEIAFNLDPSWDWEKSALSFAALRMAEFTWEVFAQRGAHAVGDVRAASNSLDVEDCVSAAVVLTGTVSSLMSGGRQLAIAHALYDAVCKHYKEQQRRFLHGEIVSAGIPLQLYVNGATPDQIDDTRAFLRAVGTPTTLKDLSIDRGSADVDLIFSHICRNAELQDVRLKDRLRQGLEAIAE